MYDFIQSDFSQTPITKLKRKTCQRQTPTFFKQNAHPTPFPIVYRFLNSDTNLCRVTPDRSTFHAKLS